MKPYNIGSNDAAIENQSMYNAQQCGQRFRIWHHDDGDDNWTPLNWVKYCIYNREKNTVKSKKKEEKNYGKIYLEIKSKAKNARFEQNHRCCIVKWSTKKCMPP